jgi:hypothetical protein
MTQPQREKAAVVTRSVERRRGRRRCCAMGVLIVAGSVSQGIRERQMGKKGGGMGFDGVELNR